uniref:Uncharacterized protein n=1 Tax=Parascaris equorum TaxID=6256 RepID=A0A914RWU6_PAREQ
MYRLKIDGYEELLADVVNICSLLFENHMYITPAERHMFVKSLEVVPLFGDMQIQPFSFVKRSPFFDSSKWPASNTEDGPRSDAENREMTQLALSGIQLLCGWTSDVVETISWKLLHPTDHRLKDIRGSTGKPTFVVRLTLIPLFGSQAMLMKMESVLSVAIRRHIYAELQDFVQLTLKEPLHKALKNKKDVVAGVIQSICDTCVDDCSGQFDSRSPDIGKSKKQRRSTTGSVGDIRTGRRSVAPSSTQVYFFN